MILGKKIAITCCPKGGPSFGCYFGDIYITNCCNREHECSIRNDGTGGYECHPEYKSSLFVNSDGPNNRNTFSVLDYEVYTIDNYKDFIYNECKHPNIIWEYLITRKINEQSLRMIGDEVELIDDLDLIGCYNDAIRLNLSDFFFQYPSNTLPYTRIVDKKYDSYLREWIGDYKWRLLYRASEHAYTAESFHEYCDDQGPTLVVIKSSGGWIFGGYTTQSWSGESIYYLMQM